MFSPGLVLAYSFIYSLYFRLDLKFLSMIKVLKTNLPQLNLKQYIWTILNLCLCSDEVIISVYGTIHTNVRSLLVCQLRCFVCANHKTLEICISDIYIFGPTNKDTRK